MTLRRRKNGRGGLSRIVCFCHECSFSSKSWNMFFSHKSCFLFVSQTPFFSLSFVELTLINSSYVRGLLRYVYLVIT